MVGVSASPVSWVLGLHFLDERRVLEKALVCFFREAWLQKRGLGSFFMGPSTCPKGRLADLDHKRIPAQLA